MRITVYDVLSYLAAGMSHHEILDDFPYLKEDDILACPPMRPSGNGRRLWCASHEGSSVPPQTEAGLPALRLIPEYHERA